MADIEELVQKFREKLLIAQEAERYKNEVINPLVNRVFVNDFAYIFENITSKLNNEIGSRVISFLPEGKNRFVIEGQYHRVIFQKGKVDLVDGLISANIIPIYIWKGVTKHLGPITFFIDPATEQVRWDILQGTPDEYSKYLFGKLIDDEDFSM